MNKKRKTNRILIVAISICYIIYSIFWLRAAMIQANIENSLLTEGMTQIAKEGTIRNISELFTYILFLIFCLHAWEDTKRKKYRVYFIKTGSVTLGLLVLGVIFSGIQYVMYGVFSNNYMIPVVILIGIMLAVLLFVSGKQAKKEIEKK